MSPSLSHCFRACQPLKSCYLSHTYTDLNFCGNEEKNHIPTGFRSTLHYETPLSTPPSSHTISVPRPKPTRPGTLKSNFLADRKELINRIADNGGGVQKTREPRLIHCGSIKTDSAFRRKSRSSTPSKLLGPFQPLTAFLYQRQRLHIQARPRGRSGMVRQVLEQHPLPEVCPR